MSEVFPGWGAEPYGSGPWGGSPSIVPGAFILSNAIAIAENIVRLTFNISIYFTGLLDPFDASIPDHYSISPVDGTIGLDGLPPQPVGVVTVALAPVGGGTMLDLTLDRPMSPYPARYTATATGVISMMAHDLIDPTKASFEFYGMFKFLEPPQLDTSVPSRDIANPQTLSAAEDPLPNPFNSMNLGTIVVDGSGDYAFDEGITNLKKRIYRRLVSNPGKFAHIPTYGVGIPQNGKRLATSGVKASLAAEAERQIKLEPEVDRVLVTVTNDATTPNLIRFNILVKTKTGAKSKFSVPFSTV